MQPVPYCVQTADLAAAHNVDVPNEARSVPQLLDLRAHTHGNRLAAGFPENGADSSDAWTSVDFSASMAAILRLTGQRPPSWHGRASIWLGGWPDRCPCQPGIRHRSRCSARAARST